MTTEPEEVGDTARRKFDDVAQLFGSIVPPPGTTPRPQRPFRPLPTSLPAQPPPQIVPLPAPVDASERAEPLSAAAAPKPPAPAPLQPPEPLTAPAPAPAFAATPATALAPATIPVAAKAPAQVSSRPRPTEIPWPDAFEPRPNFRKRQPRKLSWLLLIPAGLVAAVAVTMLDTRALRSWVDAHVLHRTPIPATLESPLLPAPFRTGSATGQTSAAAPGTPATPEPEPPILYPALPTSPVPVPPGTEVSPPPAEPATTPAPPMHVTIQFRRGIPGADGEARRLAALLQSTGGSVELRPNASTVKVPTITYYHPADQASASALALVLANEAPNWTLRLGAAPGTASAGAVAATAKPPPGSLDIWLP